MPGSLPTASRHSPHVRLQTQGLIVDNLRSCRNRETEGQGQTLVRGRQCGGQRGGQSHGERHSPPRGRGRVAPGQEGLAATGHQDSREDTGARGPDTQGPGILKHPTNPA